MLLVSARSFSLGIGTRSSGSSVQTPELKFQHPRRKVGIYSSWLTAFSFITPLIMENQMEEKWKMKWKLGLYRGLYGL